MKKDRQPNDPKKKDKRTNNVLQNIIHKTKDPVTRTPLKTEGELRCSGRVGSFCYYLWHNHIKQKKYIIIKRKFKQ